MRAAQATHTVLSDRVRLPPFERKTLEAKKKGDAYVKAPVGRREVIPPKALLHFTYCQSTPFRLG